MRLFARKRVVGLDIGAAAVKAVALSRQGKRVVLAACETLDIRAEGVLNEGELYASVAEWLERIGWADEKTSVGLPQYLATT